MVGCCEDSTCEVNVSMGQCSTEKRRSCLFVFSRIWSLIIIGAGHANKASAKHNLRDSGPSMPKLAGRNDGIKQACVAQTGEAQANSLQLEHPSR